MAGDEGLDENLNRRARELHEALRVFEEQDSEREPGLEKVQSGSWSEDAVAPLERTRTVCLVVHSRRRERDEPRIRRDFFFKTEVWGRECEPGKRFVGNQKRQIHFSAPPRPKKKRVSQKRRKRSSFSSFRRRESRDFDDLFVITSESSAFFQSIGALVDGADGDQVQRPLGVFERGALRCFCLGFGPFRDF